MSEQLTGRGQYKGRKAKGEQASQLTQLAAEIEALISRLDKKTE